MALTLASSLSQYWIRPIGLTRDSFGGQFSDGPGVTFVFWARSSETAANNYSVLGLSNGAQGGTGIHTNQYQGIALHEVCDDNTQTSEEDGGGASFDGVVWTCVVCFIQPNGEVGYYYNTDSVFGTFYQGATIISNNITYSNLYVGSYPDNSSDFGGFGASANIQVAEFAVWKGTLGLGESIRLMTGENPSTIRPSNLYCYYPLRGDLNDHGPQHIALQPQGGAQAVWSEHPPVASYRKITRGFKPITTSTSGNVYMNYPW